MTPLEQNWRVADIRMLLADIRVGSQPPTLCLMEYSTDRHYAEMESPVHSVYQKPGRDNHSCHTNFITIEMVCR